MFKSIFILSILISSLFSDQILDLDIEGTVYTVKMKENKHLNALSKTSAFFYKGEVNEDENSWVRLSFKKRRWIGTAYIFGSLYQIN